MCFACFDSVKAKDSVPFEDFNELQVIHRSNHQTVSTDADIVCIVPGCAKVFIDNGLYQEHALNCMLEKIHHTSLKDIENSAARGADMDSFVQSFYGGNISHRSWDSDRICRYFENNGTMAARNAPFRSAEAMIADFGFDGQILEDYLTENDGNSTNKWQQFLKNSPNVKPGFYIYLKAFIDEKPKSAARLLKEILKQHNPDSIFLGRDSGKFYGDELTFQLQKYGLTVLQLSQIHAKWMESPERGVSVALAFYSNYGNNKIHESTIRGALLFKLMHSLGLDISKKNTEQNLRKKKRRRRPKPGVTPPPAARKLARYVHSNLEDDEEYHNSIVGTCTTERIIISRRMKKNNDGSYKPVVNS